MADPLIPLGMAVRNAYRYRYKKPSRITARGVGIDFETFSKSDVPRTMFWRFETFGAMGKPLIFSMNLASRAIATNGNNVLGEASSQGAYRLESTEL